MSDITHEMNQLIRGTVQPFEKVAATAIQEGLPFLFQKPSVKIDVNIPAKGSFSADVAIAQTMAEEGKSIADIESYLESHSAAFDRSTNKEAYMSTVMARTDQLTTRKKAHEQEIGKVAEISKAVEQVPEITL